MIFKTNIPIIEDQKVVLKTLSVPVSDILTLKEQTEIAGRAFSEYVEGHNNFDEKYYR
jgi:hypothetical protein